MRLSDNNIYHNIGIILLGDWQKAYVCGELDDFFALSKEGRIHHLSMSRLIDQLEARSKSNGSYTPLSYPFYQQEPQIIKGGEAGPNTSKPASNWTGNHTTSSKEKEKEGKASFCSHCKKGPHTEDECWTKASREVPSN